MELKTLRYHLIAVAILILIFFIINTLASNLVVPTRYTIDKTAPMYLDYAYYIDGTKTKTFDNIINQPEQLTHHSFSNIPWSFKQQNYWLFLDLENKSLNQQSVVAHFDNPMVDHLTIYRLDKKKPITSNVQTWRQRRLPLFI